MTLKEVMIQAVLNSTSFLSTNNKGVIIMNHIIKDIILRTVYTFLESLLSMLVVGNLISSFDWITILSVSATAALIAFIRAVMVAIKKIDPDVTD
jgi:hypothetical protein